MPVKLHYESAIHEIKSDNALVELPHSTRNLGNTLTLTKHAIRVCKVAHHHVRTLRHVRKCTSEDIHKSIDSTLVGARLDYCNALFYGTSSSKIDKLHYVQNILASVVKKPAVLGGHAFAVAGQELGTVCQ
jgi:hypothetical protein